MTDSKAEVDRSKEVLASDEENTVLRIGKRSLEAESEDAAVQPETKRKKKHKKRKRMEDDAERELDLEKGINLTFVEMNSSLLADHVACQTKKFNPKMSMIELEDRRLPGRSRQRG